MYRGRCISFSLIIVGVICLTASLIFISIGNRLIQKLIDKECQLRDGTLVYKTWLTPPVPTYMSIYVFDLQNPIEFLSGSKPILVERGPFVYREVRTKTNVRFYENNTISYQEPREYIFNRTLSFADDSYNFTTVNLVYMTLVNYLQMEKTPNVYRRIIGELLALSEQPLMTHSVKEYLWGYRDPLLHELKTALPQLVSDDRVAVFGSAVEVIGYDTFLIKSGVNSNGDDARNSDQIGILERFNYSSNLSIWFDMYANMLNGTDSTLWHPNARKDERIYAFIRDICRSVYLTYNETRRNFAGIDVYHYTLPTTIFANLTENDGFCSDGTIANKTETKHCLPSGLFTQTPCQHLTGSTINIPLPVIASNPHFLDVDPVVFYSVEGMNPNDELHRSFGQVEPRTGVIMNGSRRLQFNINVVNDSSISSISKLRPVYYPLFWGNEHAEIDEPTAKIFRKSVILPIQALTVIKYVLLGIGIICIIIGCLSLGLQQYGVKHAKMKFPKATPNETSALVG